MVNDTEIGGARHPRAAIGLILVSLAGCGGPPTGAALVELPTLVVITTPAAAGDPVQLELRNDTSVEVTFAPLPCATSIERFRFGEWVEARPPAEQCTGEAIIVPPGASRGYLAEMPPLTGRHRAVLPGTTANGSFVVRSAGFVVP